MWGWIRRRVDWGLDDQIISWAIIGTNCEVLGSGLVKATVPFSESARATHHLREEDLADAPGFADAWATMEALLEGKTVVTYGATFDLRLLRQSAAACQMPLSGLDESRCYCVLEAYATFCEEPDRKP
jgi:DNA polymerase III subunit epsilon